MHNFAHKESGGSQSIGAAQASRGPWRPCIKTRPGAKEHGGSTCHMAVASMGPSRRERTNQGLCPRKNRKEIETEREQKIKKLKKKKKKG